MQPQVERSRVHLLPAASPHTTLACEDFVLCAVFIESTFNAVVVLERRALRSPRRRATWKCVTSQILFASECVVPTRKVADLQPPNQAVHQHSSQLTAGHRVPPLALKDMHRQVLRPIEG